MVLRFIIGNPNHRTVKTERVKLMAGGCQLIAVGTFVSSIVSPLFNPTIAANPKTHVMGALGFALFELLALRILNYLPTAPED